MLIIDMNLNFVYVLLFGIRYDLALHVICSLHASLNYCSYLVCDLIFRDVLFPWNYSCEAHMEKDEFFMHDINNLEISGNLQGFL